MGIAARRVRRARWGAKQRGRVSGGGVGGEGRTVHRERLHYSLK
jgi:hypothetical protein